MIFALPFSLETSFKLCTVATFTIYFEFDSDILGSKNIYKGCGSASTEPPCCATTVAQNGQNSRDQRESGRKHQKKDKEGKKTERKRKKSSVR